MGNKCCTTDCTGEYYVTSECFICKGKIDDLKSLLVCIRCNISLHTSCEKKYRKEKYDCDKVNHTICPDHTICPNCNIKSCIGYVK